MDETKYIGYKSIHQLLQDSLLLFKDLREHFRENDQQHNLLMTLQKNPEGSIDSFLFSISEEDYQEFILNNNIEFFQEFIVAYKEFITNSIENISYSKIVKEDYRFNSIIQELKDRIEKIKKEIDTTDTHAFEEYHTKLKEKNILNGLKILMDNLLISIQKYNTEMEKNNGDT